MYRRDTSGRDKRSAAIRISQPGGAGFRPVAPLSSAQTQRWPNVTSNRQGVLELAVLGLLHKNPMHGYELRKRLNTLLGMFRAFSYGSLYPCLKQLLQQGLITEDRPEEPNVALALQSRRSKIVYKLTADGKERLQLLLTEAGPAAWE